MGTWGCSLVFLVVLLQNDLARALAPLLCSSSVCQINPTQNTITLEKPFCAYTQPSLVALYVVQNSAVNNAIDFTNTFSNTGGGSTAPYVAGTFANLNCTDNPVVSDITNYVYRVGSSENCFNTQFCNGPLANNTAYRFKYAFYSGSNTPMYQSDWSAPITTRQGKYSSTIDTWPGRRSGGMIVLTSILSVLNFLVLAGLVAAMITYFMGPTKELEPVRHQSQIINVPQKPEGGASGISERYVPGPQV